MNGDNHAPRGPEVPEVIEGQVHKPLKAEEQQKLKDQKAALAFRLETAMSLNKQKRAAKYPSS